VLSLNAETKVSSPTLVQLYIKYGFERWWVSSFELGFLIGSLPLGLRTPNSREEVDSNPMGLR
jgi:hypothetical protein